MSKHTPGPWVSTKTERGIPVVRDRNGTTICMFDWRDLSKQKSNAALISAAPDMYKALKIIQTQRPFNAILHWDAAEAALAKAEGIAKPEATLIAKPATSI